MESMAFPELSLVKVFTALVERAKAKK